MTSKSKKAITKPKKSTSTLPQVNWPIVVKYLLGFGTFVLLWMTGSWAMKNLTPTPKPVYKCSTADDGFQTVFCGKNLMAMKNIDNPSLVMVKTSRPSAFDRKSGVVQTMVDIGKKTSVLSPHEDIIAKIIKRGSRERVLLLGLGGGAIPLLLTERCPDCEIVAVDLFEDALTIARQFVIADVGKRIQYVQRDANRYVADAPTESFDVVIMDVSQGAYQPEFLFSAEFIGNIKRLMRDDAVCLTNVFAPEGTTDRFLRMFMTLRQAFPSVDMASPSESKHNFLFVSSKIEPPVPEPGAGDDINDDEPERYHKRYHDHEPEHDHGYEDHGYESS